MVQHADDFPLFLYIEAGICLFIFICILIHYPDKPEQPPARIANENITSKSNTFFMFDLKFLFLKKMIFFHGNLRLAHNQFRKYRISRFSPS